MAFLQHLYLSAGALAYLISLLIEGQNIETAVNDTLEELTRHDNHQEYKIFHEIPIYIGEASYKIIKSSDEYKAVKTITPHGFLKTRNRLSSAT